MEVSSPLALCSADFSRVRFVHVMVVRVAVSRVAAGWVDDGFCCRAVEFVVVVVVVVVAAVFVDDDGGDDGVGDDDDKDIDAAVDVVVSWVLDWFEEVMIGLCGAIARMSFIVVDAVDEGSWACEANVVVTGTFDDRIRRVETSVMQNKI